MLDMAAVLDPPLLYVVPSMRYLFHSFQVAIIYFISLIFAHILKVNLQVWSFWYIYQQNQMHVISKENSLYVFFFKENIFHPTMS